MPSATSRISIPISISILALLIGTASATSSNEGLNSTTEFSYKEGPRGPSKWGSLCDEYKECSAGKMQSPVNIITKQVVNNKYLKPLQRNYANLANATMVNWGYIIGVRYENAGVLIIDGKNYTFRQMHWHTPAEHQIDGEQFAAELHMVHKSESDDEKVAVVSTLYRYGDNPDPVISNLKIKSNLHKLAHEKCTLEEIATIPVGPVAIKPIKRKTRKYYRYVGSFSTPPCTQGVIWTILGKVRTITKEQVEALDAPLLQNYKRNARPLQPLNHRKVEAYDELWSVPSS